MSRPLRLMHVFPGFGFGGTQLRMARILTGIGSRASHTIVPLDGRSEAAARLGPQVRAEIAPPPPRDGFGPYALKLLRAVRAHQPDLLLTYNWGTMDAVIGACLGRACPVVHNECGFGPDEAVRLKRRRVLTRRFVLRRIYATVVTSRKLLDICRYEFRLPEGKARWIRTAVNTEAFRPDSDRCWRRQIGVEDDELLVGFLGGLRPEKNLDLLVRAFTAAALPKARLVLIGEGPCRPALEQLARDSGAAGRVIFAGHADFPPRALAALDLFAMSSSTEQTSNALLEAMATGLPAVVTDVGDCREVLGAEGGIVVPAGDCAAYAGALAAMAASAERRRAGGEANRRRCLVEYSSDRMVREYQALYEEAVETKT